MGEQKGAADRGVGMDGMRADAVITRQALNASGGSKVLKKAKRLRKRITLFRFGDERANPY